MAMWPSEISAPDWGLEGSLYKPKVKVEFEANYVQTRARCTRGRNRWQLKWGTLAEAEYQILEAFFTAQSGNVFIWQHPLTGVSYNCIFSDDDLQSRIVTDECREVTCNIEEV